MEQKVVISNSEKEINEFLDKGWKVVSVTPQHVAISSPANGSVSYNLSDIRGKFCFVLERSK
jgi:hypothetical protein